ncbi:MAG: hypothetical protein J6Y20_04310, partial [Lachnospiraceae bacterium]|nr:hypothetical protein [Lachnospiraceae bacterium]
LPFIPGMHSPLILAITSLVFRGILGLPLPLLQPPDQLIHIHILNLPDRTLRHMILTSYPVHALFPTA